MGLHSREQRGSKELNCWSNIIYPGERIPRWFCYSEEVRDDNNLCEIDINGAQHWDDIILLCFVFGLRVGINLKMKETTIEVRIGTPCHGCIFISTMKVNRMDSDHVWMGYCRIPSASHFKFQMTW